MPNHNPDNYKRLESLSPLEAVRVWLAGDFAIDEDEALLSAVRSDLSVRLPDERIFEIICDSMELEETPEVCLEKLKKS